MKHGFTNVYNLYGGLFEWVNKGGSVFHKGIQTQATPIIWLFWILLATCAVSSRYVESQSP